MDDVSNQGHVSDMDAVSVSNQGDDFRNLNVRQDESEEDEPVEEDENGLVWRTYTLEDDDGEFSDVPRSIREPDTPPILEAIRRNDLVALSKLLDDPKCLNHINTQTKQFKTPLGEMLLQSNAVDIAPYGTSGETAFHLACAHCDLEVIQLFFETLKEDKEVDDKYITFFVNMPTRLARTPLHYAAGGANPRDIVPFLLENGASAVDLDAGNKLPSDYCGDSYAKMLLQDEVNKYLENLASDEEEEDDKAEEVEGSKAEEVKSSSDEEGMSKSDEEGMSSSDERMSE